MLIISNNEHQQSCDPVYAKHKSVWRSYMNRHPSIECLFLEYHDEKDNLIEDNTFYIKGKESYHPGIRDKTLDCFDYITKQHWQYDFIIRTNLSSLWNFDALIQYLDTLPNNNVYSGCIGNHQGIPFISGSGFIMSPDVVKKIIEHKEMVNESNIIDDVDIGYLIDKIDIPFILGSRKDILSENDFLHYQYDSNVYHYRVKMIYESRDYEPIVMRYLLEKIYSM